MPGRKLTAVLLVLVIVLVVVALIRTATSAPSFRAADHPTYNQCMAAIPTEWSRNSLERERAERACLHEEQQRRGR
ncbi:MAG TPA: hypothetical protein VFU06_16700 [Longimicrobiales bacterium]|nr:hypothetical protein [Longimicrobiales bacterium]